MFTKYGFENGKFSMVLSPQSWTEIEDLLRELPIASVALLDGITSSATDFDAEVASNFIPTAQQDLCAQMTNILDISVPSDSDSSPDSPRSLFGAEEAEDAPSHREPRFGFHEHGQEDEGRARAGSGRENPMSVDLVAEESFSKPPHILNFASLTDDAVDSSFFGSPADSERNTSSAPPVITRGACDPPIILSSPPSQLEYQSKVRRPRMTFRTSASPIAMTVLAPKKRFGRSNSGITMHSTSASELPFQRSHSSSGLIRCDSTGSLGSQESPSPIFSHQDSSISLVSFSSSSSIAPPSETMSTPSPKGLKSPSSGASSGNAGSKRGPYRCLEHRSNGEMCFFPFKKEKHVCFEWKKDPKYSLDPRFSPYLERKSPFVVRERSNTFC